jgi:hypothetical protein
MANSSNSNDDKNQGDNNKSQPDPPKEELLSEKLKNVKLPGPNAQSIHRRGDSADFSEGKNRKS